MLIGVGVSCCFLYSIVSYLYVSYSGLITSVGEERANYLLFTCNHVVSVKRGFPFLLVHGQAVLFYCGTPWAVHIIILDLTQFSVGSQMVI